MLVVLCGNGFIYLKAIKCEVSAEWIHSNYSCHAKSWSRNISTANVNFVFKKPVLEIWVTYFWYFLKIFKVIVTYEIFQKGEANTYYKYGTIYRKVFYAPRLEMCQLVNVTREQNIIVYYLILQVKTFNPKLIHNCPYNELIAKNFTFTESLFPDVIPTGDYKTEFHGSDRKNRTIFDVTFYANAKSSDPHSWG